MGKGKKTITTIPAETSGKYNKKTLK